MRLMDQMRRLPQPVTAMRLAGETGVSPRQLYRDIATLRAGGALIDGEAGVGYTLTEDPALPPQSFSRLEIEALLLAISALRGIGDAQLTAAGEDAMARIIATLPEAQGRHAMHAAMKLFRPMANLPQTEIDMGLLRQALWDERSLLIDYLDLQGNQTRREILPLGVSYGENHIMLLAYCQLRQGYRTFHVPRIRTMADGGTSFRPRRVAMVREYVAIWRASREPGTHSPG